MDCELLKRLFVENKQSQITEIVDDVVKRIHKRELVIIEIIAGLKGFLVSDEENDRVNGVQILSDILARLEKNFLSEQEVDCIFEFYINRAKDRARVVEQAIPGILAMIEYEHFTFERAQLLFHALQNDVGIQMFKPATKCSIYRAVQLLYARFQEQFLGSFSSFFYGFLSIVDAETSPVCLETVFDMFYEVGKNPKFEPFKEDLFESMAGYFPIIYSKENDATHLKTKQKLSKLLIRAMTASPSFSEFVFSISFEKLESESMFSKISSYQLLDSGLKEYELIHIKAFTLELWTFIRIDTLKTTPSEENVEKYAFRVLAQVGKLVSEDSPVVTKVWRDLEVALKSPELNLIEPSISILNAFSSQNPALYRHFFNNTYPIVFQTFLFNADNDFKANSLSGLTSMVRHGRLIEATFEVNLNDWLRVFGGVLEETLKHSGSKLTRCSLEILSEVVNILALDEVLIRKLVLFLNEIRNKEHFEDFRDVYMKLILDACRMNPNSMMKHFVDPLCELLLLKIERAEIQSDPESGFQLSLLSQMSLEPKIFSCLLEFYMKLLNTLLPESKIDDSSASFQNVVLKTFCDKLGEFSRELPEDEFKNLVALFVKKCAVPLLDSVLTGVFVDNSLLLSSTSINLVGELVNILIEHDTPFSSMDTYTDVVCSKTLTKLTSMNRPIVVDLANASTVQTEVFFVLCNAFIRSSLEGEPSKLIECTLQDLQSLNLTNNNNLPRISLIFSRNVNKLLFKVAASEFSEVFQRVINSVQSGMTDPSTLEFKLRINLLMWICNVGLSKENPQTTEIISFLLEHCNEDTFLFCLSRLPEVLYTQEDSSTEPNKFSTRISELLCAKYNNASKSHKILYFYLLIAHYKFAPKEILIEHFPEVLPNVLDGLTSFEFQKASHACFDLLESIQEYDPNHLKNTCLARVFRSVIECARSSPSLRVRRRALNFLDTLIDSCHHEQELENNKTEFLREIKPTLSDPKRLVRSIAARVHVRMCMLGQPGCKH